MARQRIDGTKVQVLVPDGDLDEIERRGVNRSEFIRAAISEKLQAGGASSARDVSEPGQDGGARSEKKFDGQAVKDGLRPDAAVLLSALRGKRLTSRDAEKAMGWLGLRYSKAEKQLIQAGLARIEDGVLVAEGEG